MNYFPKIDRWHIPEAALAKSVEEMAIDGRDGNEGTCFWLGRRADREAEVSQLVLLRGNGISKKPFNIRISPDLMRQVHEQAERQGLVLLGQIHSHSGRCGVDMSESDHAYGITAPYLLSIICPNFAQDPMTKIVECGVHVCLPARNYVRLSRKQVEQKLMLVPGKGVDTVAVGENI